MNPFSGFMQAVGSLPGFEIKTAGSGKHVHGLATSDDEPLPVGDAVGSFLELVQQLIGSNLPESSDVESAIDLQDRGPESDARVLDQLQALIAEAMDQVPAGQQIPQVLNAETLEDGQYQVLTRIIQAINVPHDGKQPLDQTSQPAMPGDAQAVLGARPNGAAVIPTQSAATDQTLPNSVPGIPTQTGVGSDNQVKENPLDGDIKASAPKEGLEKEMVRPGLNTVPLANDEGKDKLQPSIQERSPSGWESPKNAIEPVPARQHILAGQTKAPESIAMASTDQQWAASDDDMAHSQAKNQSSQTERVVLAQANKEEWQKDQPSDPVKSAAPEHIKSQPTFQETAKTMSAEPSTHAAGKPTADQAARLTPYEAPTAKAFQTTVMDQIVDKAAMRSMHGRSEIQIRLKPEFLGNVQMNIARDKEQLMVRILTDQPVVKEIIETHLHHLKAELHNQGLTIDKFEVVVNPNADQQNSREQFAQMFKNHSFQNGRRQPREQKPETWNPVDGDDSGDDPSRRDGVNYFA